MWGTFRVMPHRRACFVAIHSSPPVAAGFDVFQPQLIQKYFRGYAAQLDISPRELLALGRKNPHDDEEPFNMTYLALRGCSRVNGVSRLHAEVSRRLFHELYSGWPECEVR